MASKEFLKTIREGSFYEWMDKRKPTETNVEYFDERYYNNPEWPTADASESKIRSFIADALKAEEKIVSELKEDGMDEDEAIFEACQWPLREHAPLFAARAYLRYVEENAEAASKGLIID